MSICETCGKEKEDEGPCKNCLAIRRSVSKKQQTLAEQEKRERDAWKTKDSGLKPITQDVQQTKSPITIPVVIAIILVVGAIGVAIFMQSKTEEDIIMGTSSHSESYTLQTLEHT